VQKTLLFTASLVRKDSKGRYRREIRDPMKNEDARKQTRNVSLNGTGTTWRMTRNPTTDDDRSNLNDNHHDGTNSSCQTVP
jgi:hypothetical protein